jgi:hypothetical protein
MASLGYDYVSKHGHKVPDASPNRQLAGLVLRNAGPQLEGAMNREPVPGSGTASFFTGAEGPRCPTSTGKQPPIPRRP